METEYFQVEMAIQENNKHRWDILASIRSPILALSADMMVLFCNSAYAELVGKQMEEMIGHDMQALFPDFKHTPNYHVYLNCLDSGKAQELEGWWGEKFLQTQVFPIPEGLLIVFQDLTERKQIENSIRQSVASLARSNAFIAALGEVAARIEDSSNPRQAIEALGSELIHLGIDCAVTLLDPETGDLVVCYISLNPVVVGQIEAMMGLALTGLRLPATIVNHIGDLQSTEAQFISDLVPYLSNLMPQFSREMFEQAVLQSEIHPGTPLICLPIKGKEHLLGHLSVWGSGLREEDIPTLSIFANQVGGVIEKTRLIEALERRSKEAETLRQATAAVSSALDLDKVLDRILIQLERVIPYHSAAIFLIESERMRIVAARGFSDPTQVVGSMFTADDPLLSEARYALKPLVLIDAQTDPRFEKWCGTNHVHGWMGVPLVARGEVIGYLTIDSHQVGAFDEGHAALSQAFANEVAIAIENARLFQETHRLSITDPLTGLYNRRHLYNIAERELERSLRYERPLSVIMFDLDRFKDVNDHFGHSVGDQVLQFVAIRCQKNLRRHVEMMGRYGGEEFVVVLPETDLDGACQVAERLRDSLVNGSIETKWPLVRVTASFGVAELDESCRDLDKLLDRADQALYASKRSGGNQITTFREIAG